MKVLDKRIWEQLTTVHIPYTCNLIEQFFREEEKVRFANNVKYYLKPLALT